MTLLLLSGIAYFLFFFSFLNAFSYAIWWPNKLETRKYPAWAGHLQLENVWMGPFRAIPLPFNPVTISPWEYISRSIRNARALSLVVSGSLQGKIRKFGLRWRATDHDKRKKDRGIYIPHSWPLVQCSQMRHGEQNPLSASSFSIRSMAFEQEGWDDSW